jgi:GNAT superfamily N-acetyltransferase
LRIPAKHGPLGSLFVTYEWSDWRNGWYWWIQGAYTVPDQRGQGVFRALYEAVHAAALQAGDVKRIRLYVHDGNEAGLATYRALGMTEEPYRIFDAAVKKSELSYKPSHSS